MLQKKKDLTRPNLGHSKHSLRYWNKVVVGGSLPQPRESSMDSCADLHRRIHSSWKKPHLQNQGHSQTQISIIIFFLPQKKTGRRSRAEEGRELQLEESLCVLGFWGQEAEERNRSRITGGGLCVYHLSHSLRNLHIDLLTLSHSFKTSCLSLPSRTLL